MGKLRKMTCVLCKELCDHFESFEDHPNKEDLCIMKELTETINNLEEIEAAGAMRQYAEDKLGYDSHTGRFDMDKSGEWDEYDLGIYDAMDRRQRRDRRGRFMNTPYTTPPYYYPDYMSPYAEHDGRSGSDMGRDMMNGMDRNDGRRMGGNMMNNGGGSNEMYRVRQEGGRPMMERMYAMGDKDMKPKKLTDHDIEEWMKHIENSDGTRGAHFSKEEVKQMAQKHGVKFDDFSELDLYLATNMMYSDYCESLGTYTKNPDAYVKMAVDFLEDDDFEGTPSEKLSLYWHDIVKHK